MGVINLYNSFSGTQINIQKSKDIWVSNEPKPPRTDPIPRTNPFLENLTKPIFKGGLGFVTLSLKILTLQISWLLKSSLGNYPWHSLFKHYIISAKPNKSIRKFWSWDEKLFNPSIYLNHNEEGCMNSWLEALNKINPFIS